MAATSIADKLSKLEKKIAKREDSKPDTETESIKTEIIRIDSEIQKLMEKHDVAAAMIVVVLISDETGIEVKFSI